MATTKTNKTEEVSEEKEIKRPKTVKIFLYKDDNLKKDDLIVCLNFKPYRIKRGVEVEVPADVAEIIRNSDIQDAASLGYIEEIKNKEKSKKE